MKAGKLLWIILPLLFAGCRASDPTGTPVADLLLFNGNIITVDSQFTIAEAIVPHRSQRWPGESGHKTAKLAWAMTTQALVTPVKTTQPSSLSLPVHIPISQMTEAITAARIPAQRHDW